MSLTDPKDVLKDLLVNNWDDTNVNKPNIFIADNKGRTRTRDSEEIKILNKTVENREGNLTRSVEDINVNVIINVVSRDDKIEEYKTEIARIIAYNKTAVEGLSGGWDEIKPPETDFGNSPDYVEHSMSITVELIAKSKSKNQLY
jgi:hypothetical protein